MTLPYYVSSVLAEAIEKRGGSRGRASTIGRGAEVADKTGERY